MNVPIPKTEESSKLQDENPLPCPKWNSAIFCELYKDEVQRNLERIPVPNVNMVNKDFANCINMLCNSLCDVVRKSVEVFLQKLTVKKPRRNQRWWNVDCVKF